MNIISKTASVFFLPLFFLGIAFAQEQEMGDVPSSEEQNQMTPEDRGEDSMMMEMEEIIDAPSPESFPMMQMRRQTMPDTRMGWEHMDHMRQMYDVDNHFEKKEYPHQKSGCKYKNYDWKEKSWGKIFFWKLGKIIGGVLILFLGTFVVRKSWDFAGSFPKKKK
ncbi:hypothetical protein K9M59_00260 [Candidatus Gracilibacteria bacterium]|nr:hypothetical protein [Candidatus Gracilibacteria bacterium]MCF7819015.1 hypothetical protein [Candidatus Gracilibacteria bacterium]